MTRTVDTVQAELEAAEAKVAEIGLERAEVIERMRAAARVVESLTGEIAALRRLEGMGEDEKRALLQSLQGVGIPSSEAVGQPGA